MTKPQKAAAEMLADLALQIRYVTPSLLAAHGRQAKRHPKEQIVQIANSIRTFGFAVPVIVDEQNRIIAGTARIEAAIKLGMDKVPVVTVSHMSSAQKRAFVIAENQLATKGHFDKNILRMELEELRALDLDFELEVIGFCEAEIDAIILGGKETGSEEPVELPSAPTSRLGDLWLLGDHRLFCGDSTNEDSLTALLNNDKARMVFTDIPYNCLVEGHVTGSRAHGEFVMASGEMSDAEFANFMQHSFARISDNLVPGGLAYFCIDWRQMDKVFTSVSPKQLELINLIVWDKGVGGMGSFYRSQHELVFLYCKPGAAHTNRVQLGKHGRNRSNLWTYDGVSGFGTVKADLRALHPTVKNLDMVRDAILDATARGELVLDLFSGSGTTIIAAHEAGRRAAAIDLDPRYVDTGILRWEAFAGREALLASTRQTFREVRHERANQPTLPPARPRSRKAA